MPTDSLFRLPEGLVGLRLDFGTRLRRFRREEGLTQAELAERTGLRRETISRIEAGRVQPRPDTIDEITRVLQLDMGQLAVRGRGRRTTRPSRYFDGSSRGETRHHIGQAIRKGRKVEGMSLRKLADRSGLSPAQLSRIERGEGEKSSAYKDRPEDGHWPAEKRRFSLAIPELQRLADIGFAAQAATRAAALDQEE